MRCINDKQGAHKDIDGDWIKHELPSTTKKYFTKYLPVEGEIKEGDTILYNNRLATATHISYVIKFIDETENTVLDTQIQIDSRKKIKLFLCSRNIQIGDKVFHDTNVQNSGFTWTDSHNNKMRKDDVYKVIGEISRETTWVKEGDEFDENELGWLLWDTRFPEDGDIFYEFSNEPEIKDKYSFKVICVMGPCGNFH